MFYFKFPYLLKVRERFLVCLTFYTLLFMWVLFYNIYYQDLFFELFVFLSEPLSEPIMSVSELSLHSLPKSIEVWKTLISKIYRNHDLFY